MPTNPSPLERNRRHVADQAVTVPTKASIPVCTVDDVFNRRFNDGPQAGWLTEKRVLARIGWPQSQQLLPTVASGREWGFVLAAQQAA